MAGIPGIPGMEGTEGTAGAVAPFQSKLWKASVAVASAACLLAWVSRARSHSWGMCSSRSRRRPREPAPCVGVVCVWGAKGRGVRALG